MIAVSAQVPQGPILPIYAPRGSPAVAAQTTAVNEKAKDYCKFARTRVYDTADQDKVYRFGIVTRVRT